MTRFRVLLPVCAIILAAALVAGCGGESPEDTLEQTFNAEESITSGVLDISLEATVQGGTGGSFSFSLNGPFQGGDDPETLPELDLTADASLEVLGQAQAFSGGLVITADNAYVEYQEQAYEVGAQDFAQVQEALGSLVAQSGGEEDLSPTEAIRQSCETTADQTGGDPGVCEEIDFNAWTGELSEEEGVEIDGTATTKIHGDLDVDQIVQDFVKIGEASGDLGAALPTDDQVQQVADAVTEASFDIYTGEEDHQLRGIDFRLGIDPAAVPAAGTLGIETVSINFAQRFTDINQPQTITPPAQARPIDELLNELDLGALGLLGGGLALPGAGEVPAIPQIPVPTTPEG